jgi:hypothetical protein
MQRGARGPGLNNVCSLKSKGNVRALSNVLWGSFYADRHDTIFFFNKNKREIKLLFFILKTGYPCQHRMTQKDTRRNSSIFQNLIDKRHWP